MEPVVADGVAHAARVGPYRGEDLVAAHDHAPDAGFEVEVERIAQSLGIPEFGVRGQVAVDGGARREKLDGEPVCFRFLAQVPAALTCLTQVIAGAAEPGFVGQDMAFQQEMPGFMRVLSDYAGLVRCLVPGWSSASCAARSFPLQNN